MWPSPPRLCPVLSLCSVFCHPGAVSCRTPRPGGTLGRTWRLLGPNERRDSKQVFVIQSLSSEQKGIILCHSGQGAGRRGRTWRQQSQRALLKSASSYNKTNSTEVDQSPAVFQLIILKRPSCGVACDIFVRGSFGGFMICSCQEILILWINHVIPSWSFFCFLAQKCSFSTNLTYRWVRCEGKRLQIIS